MIRRQIMLFAIILLSMVYGCMSFSSKYEHIELLNNPPLNASNNDGFWLTIDVRDTELNERALKEHISLFKRTGADSQIVIYKGRIVSEWYSTRYKEPIGAMSSTKAIASIIIGQLVDENLLNYNYKV